MARPSPPAPPSEPLDIALFDSSTLIGKGVKTHLSRRRFPVDRVRVFDTGAIEEGGNLTDFNGEAMLAVRPDLEEMGRVDLAFFCGGSGTGEAYLDWPQRGRFVAIDLTQSANRRKGIPVVNALVNPEAGRRHEGLLAAPHPASQVLSTLLAPLAKSLPLLEAVSVILQPASERGEEGIEELYRQTVGVLNFTEVPKERFGKVLAFNILPRTQAAGATLPDEVIAREVDFILGGRRFPHSVTVLLVPVFHCHSFLCRVLFERAVPLAAIHEAVATQEGLRRLEDSNSASPAELAGEEGVLLGEIWQDPAQPNGIWFWGVSDNLATGIALNAVRVAEDLVRAGVLRARRIS